MAVDASPAAPDSTAEPTVEPAGIAGGPRFSLGHRMLRFAPPGIVAAAAVLALVTYGVSAPDVGRYILYWLVCIVVPGMLVARSLVGVRNTLIEDVAVGAITGLALESVSFVALDTLGVHGAIRWWWLGTLIVFTAVPFLRRNWALKPAQVFPATSAWALSAMAVVGVVIAANRFRARELSPAPSAPYVDDFFHLSLVNEMMRQGPHQVPQVAGEALTYHVFSHVHMANASTITGIAPDVVLSRLWMIPVIVLTISLVAVLAVRVTSRYWTGPVAVWLSSVALFGNSIWVDRAAIITSPLVIGSPSQILANPVFVGSCLTFIGVLGGRRAWQWSILFTLLLVIGVGAKPTVLPALFVGAVIAACAVWFVRRRIPAQVFFCIGAILTVQFSWSLVHPPVEGTITLLGSIDSIPVFREVNGSAGLRAVSETLLLDRLDDGRAWLAAGIAVAWLAAVQAARLIGLGTLAIRATRRNPIAWWLAGTYVAGWGAFLVVDQSSFGQAYFPITVIPAGAVLSCWLLVAQIDRVRPDERAMTVATGLGIGVGASLLTRGVVDGRSSSPSYGPVESALLPVLSAGAIGLLAFVVYRIWRQRPDGSHVAAAGITALLALSAPTAFGTTAELSGSLFTERPSVSESTAGFVTQAEQEAMIWLRDNTPDDAVMTTNMNCRPPDSPPESCDARSFLLSGLGGRRVVLEGWAYTPEAQALHGVDGRHYANQPSPWPDRYRLSRDAVASPTQPVLDRLVDEFGSEWIVGFRRAGPVSDMLDDLNQSVFDNGDVAIFRLDPGS